MEFMRIAYDVMIRTRHCLDNLTTSSS